MAEQAFAGASFYIDENYDAALESFNKVCAKFCIVFGLEYRVKIYGNCFPYVVIHGVCQGCSKYIFLFIFQAIAAEADVASYYDKRAATYLALKKYQRTYFTKGVYILFFRLDFEDKF